MITPTLPPPPTTGAELRDWRKRLGLSQDAAAHALGCGRRSIQMWEAGAALPEYIGLAAAYRELEASVPA
jgi:DNA-binding transcriptional regulator YiaG